MNPIIKLGGRFFQLPHYSSIVTGVRFNHGYTDNADQSKYSQHTNRYDRSRFARLAGVTLLGAGTLVWMTKDKFKAYAKEKSPDNVTDIGGVREGLPTYSKRDVSRHSSPTGGIWVTFGRGVYDVTEFVKQHPGGDNLLMAAGGSLEPFWKLYAVHQNPQVYTILESLRIGNLDERDFLQDRRDDDSDPTNPYANDPTRHPALKALSFTPYNAETPLKILSDNFITPNELFFVRNHLPVPEVDPQEYRLEIEGIGMATPISLSLHDLKTKFPKHTMTVTLQCTGNRRKAMSEVKEVKGLSWGQAAISNATWTGVKLVDVLKSLGADIENDQIKHVQFEGLDGDPTGKFYGASIPAETAFDPRRDVLLAFEMNGEPLPRDHGFPLRVITPGITGARNVKWLSRIVLSDEESHSHWQRNDYKSFSPSVDWSNVDFNSAPAIQETPIQSAISDPLDGETVKVILIGDKKFIKVRGYAYSGSGKKVVRVDVTGDSGKNWTTAKLIQEENSSLNRTWSWSLWEAMVPLPEDGTHLSPRSVEIWCKATDSSYSVQPENVEPIWNLRGCLNNSWHRVRVSLNPKSQ